MSNRVAGGWAAGDTVSDLLTAGAPVLIPARTSPTAKLLHLGRTEARKRRDPAILGICPDVLDVELVRAPALRWWRRKRWCRDCADYRDYLRTGKRKFRASGGLHPAPTERVSG